MTESLTESFRYLRREIGRAFTVGVPAVLIGWHVAWVTRRHARSTRRMELATMRARRFYEANVDQFTTTT